MSFLFLTDFQNVAMIYLLPIPTLAMKTNRTNTYTIINFLSIFQIKPNIILGICAIRNPIITASNYGRFIVCSL